MTGRWKIPEVCYEILARLPVRTLARFRSACSSWNNMITDEVPFKHYHVTLREDNPQLLLVRNIRDAEGHNILELSTYDTVTGRLISKVWDSPFIPMKPVQSSRGLVCLRGIYDGTEDRIAICQPTLGNVVFLPRIPLTDEIRIDAIGFGYSFTTKQFKVMAFCHRYDYSGEIAEFIVFTLGTSMWRVGGKPPFDLNGQVPPYLHGALHLMPDNYGGPGIGVLDIGSETCKRMIPLPEYFCNQWPSNRYGLSKLEALRGSLYLAFYTKEDLREEIWCLTDYEKGIWSRYYTTDLNYINTWPFPTPVRVMGDGSVMLHIAGKSELLRYYPIEAEDIMQRDRYHALYAESLLPLGN